MESYRYFLNFVFQPLIQVIGLFGNAVCLKVLARKPLQRIGPCNIYRMLFIADSVYLAETTVIYLLFAFKINLTASSLVFCKIYVYLNYILGNFSPWFLCYISVEKWISIQYPHRRFFLRKNKNQFIYLAGLIVLSLSYHVGSVFFYDIIIYNENSMNMNNITNGSSYSAGYKSCNFKSEEYKAIVSYMDLMMRAIVPFILMVFFSSLLIIGIRLSRHRVLNALRENARLKREIQFGISSLSMNFLFVILNFPISFVALFSTYIYSSMDLFLSTLDLLYLSYALNFYVLVFTNSVFRRELIQSFMSDRSSYYS